MAEFCLDCWNMVNNTKYTERDWVLSRGLELCEGCGEYKQVIVRERRLKFLYDIKNKG